MIGSFESTSGAFTFLIAVNAAWVLMLVSVVYVAVRRGGDGDEDGDADDENRNLIRVEAVWLVVVAIVWIGMNAYTISAMAADDPTPEENITVEASMWAYDFSDSTLPVDEPVEFRATSLDVTHSFSVYDPDGELVLTMMLVPGTEQRKVRTFEKTGKYEVRCLEYCGTGHAYMRDSFEVVEDDT